MVSRLTDASTLVYDNGVEVDGWWEPYPDKQIAALEGLLAELASDGYPNNVVGHEEIVMPLGRKRGPWAALRMDSCTTYAAGIRVVDWNGNLMT